VEKNTVRVIKTTIRCNSEEVSLSNRDVARKWGGGFSRAGDLMQAENGYFLPDDEVSAVLLSWLG
jgi:hypothetical protein